MIEMVVVVLLLMRMVLYPMWLVIISGLERRFVMVVVGVVVVTLYLMNTPLMVVDSTGLKNAVDTTGIIALGTPISLGCYSVH
jgi:hypothetical protein